MKQLPRLTILILFVFFSKQLFAQHSILKWPENKKGAVSITFDDGASSQYQLAVPLLNSYGMKGTFFIVTDRLPATMNGDIGLMPQRMATKSAATLCPTFTCPGSQNQSFKQSLNSRNP
jgi:peptidoglycan/xylan/chitin deacetylase (PgdA/CDA1 family)